MQTGNQERRFVCHVRLEHIIRLLDPIAQKIVGLVHLGNSHLLALVIVQCAHLESTPIKYHPQLHALIVRQESLVHLLQQELYRVVSHVQGEHIQVLGQVSVLCVGLEGMA